MMSRRKDKSKNFQTGDLVWAKMRGYPPWPAIIENPPNDDSKTPSKIKRKQHYVFFFGTENFAWIPDENIHHHSDKMVQSVSMKKKPLRFQSAIDRILNLNKAQSKRDEQVEIEKSEKENATVTPCTYSKSTSSNISLKKNAEATPKSKGMQQSSEKEKSEKTLNGSPQNTQRKHSFENADLYTGIPSMYPSIKRLRPEDYSFNAANFPGIPSSNSSYDGDPKTTSTSACKQQPLTSESEVLILYDSLQSNNVRATKKKIGFLGLGNMGSVLVMNLIKSGHDVMVWNRTSSRCETLVNAGAKSGQNPADVVTNCDMIFSCVSDPKEVKELVFGKDGVLKGFDSSESGKGYVEMTTIDSGTSKEISEAITRRGGRYLESYIHGSKMGEEGTLLLLISDFVSASIST